MKNVYESDTEVFNIEEPSKRDIVRDTIRDKCMSDDYLTCFTNIIKCVTQEAGQWLSFPNFILMYKRCEFDMEHHVDMTEYMTRFNQVYNSYKKKYNPNKAKGKGCVYGPNAFYNVILKHLEEEDYFWKQKKQKITKEEFMFICYLITDRYIKLGGAVLITAQYFLCKKNSNGYKKYSHRVINKHKLIYIVSILQKYEMISKRHEGIEGKKHLRCAYTLDTNNPYFRRR